MTEQGFLLYADDNADDRLLLRNAAHAKFPDLTLQCVEDGDAALTQLRRMVERGEGRLPDAVLLDLNMPRKSGLATLAELKADPLLRHIPVVIVAAARRPNDPENALRLGATAFLNKPRSQRELVETLSEVCTRWSAADEPLALTG